MTEQEKIQESIEKMGCFVFIVIPFVLAWIFASNSFVIMKLWNWFAPQVFNAIGFSVNSISFGVAFGLWMVLSLIAFPVMYYLSAHEFQTKTKEEIASICFFGPFVTLLFAWLAHFVFEWLLAAF